MGKNYFLFLSMISLIHAAITGKIIDNDQNPIQGVTLYFAQENITTYSANDGTFSIEVDESTVNRNLNEILFKTNSVKGSVEIYNLAGKVLFKGNTHKFERLYELFPEESKLPELFLVKLKNDNGEQLLKIAHTKGENNYKLLTHRSLSLQYPTAYEITMTKEGYYSTSRWVNSTDQDLGNIQMQKDYNYQPSSSSNTIPSSSTTPSSSSVGNGQCPNITPISGGSTGYGTRYWDCCKPHCSWSANTDANKICKTCDVNNNELPLSQKDAKSGCEGGGSAYTCYGQVPFEVCDKVAYGYAAVPASGAICGKCFQLEFDGKGKYSTNAAHSSLIGKTMIVMATNIGHDVAGGQFDIMIPGGGVGAFNGCSTQWGVSNGQLGAQYGGFLTACQQDLGYNQTMDKYKNCVRSKCQEVFTNKSNMTDLMAGCNFFVDWMNAADNPTFKYKEVTCPQVLKEGFVNSEITINW